MDLKQIDKLLTEAKAGLETAQMAIAALQPTIDKLDDVIPDLGPGQYLHMIRVAIDLFESTLGKVQAE